MKVPAGLPLACWLALAVVSTLARPQKLQFTPREYKAFKTVLGNNRAISITSAIPVMAFADKNPSKYVELPLEHIGGVTGNLSPAQLLHTDGDEFGTTFGRGAGNAGPAFGTHEQGKYQGVFNFNAGALQRGGGLDSSSGDGGGFGPNKIRPLTYGFKPIYDSVGSSQLIASNKASGGLVHTSFSPSPQIGQSSFRPSISVDDDDDLDLDFSALGRKPHLAEGENLYRHHVDSSLVPTSNAGPGATAVGKLLRSQGNALDESDVVARSVDGKTILNELLKEANDEKLSTNIDVPGGASHSSAAVGASITVRGSSSQGGKSSLNLPALSSPGFVSDSGAIVVRGGDSDTRKTLPDPSASIFDSSRIEASSIFAGNSVRIPQLPNVQLPLQTQEAPSFRGRELPLQSGQSTFTGNQQQVKLITQSSISKKRQAPQIPNSVAPAAKNTATTTTEELLRLLRSQTQSESEPTTQGKFTREISPQARQIPGAIPARAPTPNSPTKTTGSSNVIPPGFRPIPATPRQNGRRVATLSSEQKRSNIRFDNTASQPQQRSQATPQQNAPARTPSPKPLEQPRTNAQFGRAVSHQFHQQFHPQFSPGPFTQNPQVKPPTQLQQLQQRQQQQQQEQQQRQLLQEKRQEQQKEQQVLQQIEERQKKQEQRKEQQSQQQREQQIREQQQRQQHQQDQQQQQQQKQRREQQHQQHHKQQREQESIQRQQQQRHHKQQQQLNQQQQKERENQSRNEQQQQNQLQSQRLGTKVTTGQRQTLQEFLSGSSTSVSQQLRRPTVAQSSIPGSVSQQSQRPRVAQSSIPGSVSQQSPRPRVAQSSIPGSVSQQSQRPRVAQSSIPGKVLQQTQIGGSSTSTSQQPRLQQSKVAQTTVSSSQQLGLQSGRTSTSGSTQVGLQQSQTGTPSSASSQKTQPLRFIQHPTSTANQVVSNQQVRAKPQQNAVQQTTTIQKARIPSTQSLTSSTSPGGTSVISASSGSPFGSLPPSALQALGALGGGGAGGGQSHIVVKTISLDAKDADPSSEAFKKAVAEATKQARLELGVSDSEELGVASGDLASLLGKKRRKRQLSGGESTSTAQTTTIQKAKIPSTQSLTPSTSPGGTSVISASSGSPLGSLPPSALQALGALGGGGAGGGQSHIVVKTISLDAKDADPSSEAFKKAVAEVTNQARLELGVSDSEELGVVSGGDLASLLGETRRKRQLFGGESTSTAQTLGNALSTGAGLFGSTLGVLFDTTWEAVINFIRGTETVSLLALDQVEGMLQDPVEDTS